MRLKLKYNEKGRFEVSASTSSLATQKIRHCRQSFENIEIFKYPKSDFLNL